MSLPQGHDVLAAARDRAHLESRCPTRGSGWPRGVAGSAIIATIGPHYAAAQALAEYIDQAGLRRGPLFRPRRGGPNPVTVYFAPRTTEVNTYLNIACQNRNAARMQRASRNMSGNTQRPLASFLPPFVASIGRSTRAR
jgi:hypothetical protein